jgi:hypothetical protein
VYYINNKLKIIKGYKPNRFLVNFIGGSFLIIISFLSFKDFLPVISLVAVIMLILRAYLGLMEKYKNEKVKIIGIKEFIYGFLFVIVNSIGYLNRI